MGNSLSKMGASKAIEVQKFLSHHSILTTVRYTHLTDQTKHHALDRINGLMDGFGIAWGKVT